jgi:hypothetical protein
VITVAMSSAWELFRGLIVFITGAPDAGIYEITFRMTGLFFGTWAIMIYGVRYGKVGYWAACRWIKKRYGARGR